MERDVHQGVHQDTRRRRHDQLHGLHHGWLLPVLPGRRRLQLDLPERPVQLLGTVHVRPAALAAALAAAALTAATIAAAPGTAAALAVATTALASAALATSALAATALAVAASTIAAAKLVGLTRSNPRPAP